MDTFATLQHIQPIAVPLLYRSLQKNRLAHAYLFEGGRGTGKKRVALHFVKSYFCPHKEDVEPCQRCVHCHRISQGNHPDVHFISPLGQSIRKEQLDYLQREITFRGMERSKKVYIIEKADVMTPKVANSLLKFIEEPPAHTIVILLTERGSSILPTIVSRTQHIVFAPLVKETFRHLLEEKGTSPSISRLVSMLTTSYEEATVLLEADWIAQAQAVVIQLMEEIYHRHTRAFFTVQEKWLPLFKERYQHEIGLEMMLLWFKDLIYIKYEAYESVTYIDQKEKLMAQRRYTQTQLVQYMLAILEARKHLIANVHPQLVMEKLLLTIQEGSNIASSSRSTL